MSPWFKPLTLVVTDPHTAWPLIAATPLPTRDLLLRYLLPLSLATAASVALGVARLNRDWNFDFGYNIAAERAWGVGAATFLFAILATLVFAWVFQQLGRMYGSRRDFNAALKVAVFGATPVWATGVFMFFMPVIIIGMAAFVYSCVLYGIGAHAVLGVKDSEQNEFIGIALLFASMILAVIGMAAVALGLL